tara:strand:+ start:5378 stop:6217 length:840 start_codon:yes stop_codon:yes gene_type:complete
MTKVFDKNLESKLLAAADKIQNADAILIAAGAGMGVDSGLPDFRSGAGFWKSYSGLNSSNNKLQEFASRKCFLTTPHIAWGFYGHRLNLYRKTKPHFGFQLLKNWCTSKENGGFIYTSNIDGHFQKAGFGENDILECHGSINHLQCLQNCSYDIWPIDTTAIEVDEASGFAVSELPSCLHCGGLARPNVQMFGDIAWIRDRTDEQFDIFHQWRNASCNIVVIEIGAGVAIPSVRIAAEQIGADIIRINPNESLGGSNCISIPTTATQALRCLNEVIEFL